MCTLHRRMNELHRLGVLNGRQPPLCTRTLVRSSGFGCEVSLDSNSAHDFARFACIVGQVVWWLACVIWVFVGSMGAHKSLPDSSGIMMSVAEVSMLTAREQRSSNDAEFTWRLAVFSWLTS